MYNVQWVFCGETCKSQHCGQYFFHIHILLFKRKMLTLLISYFYGTWAAMQTLTFAETASWRSMWHSDFKKSRYAFVAGNSPQWGTRRQRHWSWFGCDKSHSSHWSVVWSLQMSVCSKTSGGNTSRFSSFFLTKTQRIINSLSGHFDCDWIITCKKSITKWFHVEEIGLHTSKLL